MNALRKTEWEPWECASAGVGGGSPTSGELHQNVVDEKVAATYGEEGRTSPREGKVKAESPMGLNPNT